MSTRSACLFAALLGCVFTIVCFFPGYMSPDSINQLWQGRAMSFSGWHPPVMSLLWGLLDRIAPGPVPMLILHNVMFWAGLGLFVYHLGFERGWAATAILLTGLSPPVFALLSTIWKDVGMGCSLVLASGLLLRAERRHSKLAWLMALVSLWYGLAARHNAIVAFIPLAIWAALISRDLFPSPSGNPRLSIILRGCLLIVLLAGASMGVTRLLTRKGSPPPVQQILVHDLVAVSLATDTIYLPEYLTEALGSRDASALKPLYNPDSVVPLFCCETDRHYLKISSEPDEVKQLWAEWRSTIPRHVGAYVRHRSKVFESELGIGKGAICAPFWHGIDPNSLNVVFHPSALNRWVMDILDRVKDGPFFWGWLYLLLLGILLTMFWLRFSRNRAAALLIGLSGLLYALAYFFVSTTCDFRMHWWTVLTVFLVALLAIAGRLRPLGLAA